MRGPTLLLLLAPAHALRAAVGPLAPAPLAPLVTRTRPLLAMASDEVDAAYRTLGLSADATYDDITNAETDMTERYAGDEAMLKRIEEAKDLVTDDKLRQRMAGARAIYEGQMAKEDRPVVLPDPPWVVANEIRKKLFQRPDLKYALRVVLLMGGLGIVPLFSAGAGQTCLLLSTVSAMGFVYNRGEAEIVRDDMGQIGEVRPMEKKPMALCVGSTMLFWFWGYFKAKRVVAAMAAPGAAVPRGLEMVVRCFLCSFALIPQCLFLKVHSVFD